MNERKIYLIRHGRIQTDNKKRYIGITDIPLSDKGKAEAELIKEKMQHIHLEKIYCSDLTRSMETAKIICEERIIKPVIVPKLREINMGTWENLSFEHVKKIYGDQFDVRGKNIESFIPPLGESFKQCYDRVNEALKEILKDSHRNILICGHSGVNKCIISSILEIPINNIFKIAQDYGCVNVFTECVGALRIESLNSKL